MTLPELIIIGAQKSGTTAAARNLSLHPQVEIFSGVTEYGQKEIEFFNQHWERGLNWYASHFKVHAGLNGEKTAELLHRKICHERMYVSCPSAKLIVLLRSPVERAYSQWKMAKFIKKDEPALFESVIEKEYAILNTNQFRHHFYNSEEKGISCWREGYLLKGMYAEQLEHLYSWFPQKQVYVAITERIRANMKYEYNKIYEFLGLSSLDLAYNEHFISPTVPPMSEPVRVFLSELYHRPNKKLFSLLNMVVPEWE